MSSFMLPIMQSLSSLLRSGASLLVGMQVALKCSCPLVKVGFFLCCLRVSDTAASLFYFRNSAFRLGLSWYFVANKW